MAEQQAQFQVLDPGGLADIARRGQPALREPDIDALAVHAATQAINHPLALPSVEVTQALAGLWERIGNEARGQIVERAREALNAWELRGRAFDAHRRAWRTLLQAAGVRTC